MKEVLTDNPLLKWYSFKIESFKTIFLTMPVLLVWLVGFGLTCSLTHHRTLAPLHKQSAKAACLIKSKIN